MLWVVALLAVGVIQAAPTPWRPTTVLVLPIEPRDGATRDLCEQVTAALVAEAGRQPAYQLVSFRELETTMAQETVRQAAGCESVSCAVEIANALDRDQIVLGSLGVVGSGYFLSLSRVRSRDARILRRSVRRFPDRDASAVLEDMGAVARELMRDERQQAPALPVKAAPAEVRTSSAAPMVLRLSAAGLGAVGVGTWLLAAGASVVAAGLVAVDLSNGDWSTPTQRRHGVPLGVAVLGDAAGVSAAALWVLGVLALAGAAAALAASWWLP
ncbi:MAG: hypothetical protein HY904_02080 [Deltaproteobacteria bacterium]|nr:hypothetical protein [Deltaproteobacteria bacterium]